MQLDINWLHNPVKEGRRSGRTTEMMANVVGIAQLAHSTSHVMVVSIDASRAYSDFIDVLRAIDPVAQYSRTICRGYPSVIVRSEYGAPCYVMFSERDVHHWASGMENAYQVIDHHYREQCDVVAKRAIDWLGTGHPRRIGKGYFRRYGIY